MKLSEDLHAALTEMSAKDVRKTLKKKGCEELRQTGSHLQVKCGDQCQTTIPMHGGDVAIGTLKSIERSVKGCVGSITR